MDLLRGNIKTLYFKYLSAAFGSALISSIYGIVDMAMVGQYQGPDGTAALAVAALVLLTKSTDCVSMAEWTLGPVSILLDAVTGLGILSIVIWFQRRV